MGEAVLVREKGTHQTAEEQKTQKSHKEAWMGKTDAKVD